MQKQERDEKLPASAPRGEPKSVGRIFSILEALSRTGSGLGLAELAGEAGAPKTSLVGLLSGLVAEKALVRDEAGRYQLGPRVHSLAMQVTGGRELVKLARPVMEALCEKTGETVIFGTLTPRADLVHYLDRIESTNAIRYAVTVGEERELYCSSMGKTLLAFLSEERFEAYLASTKLTAFTENTLTDQSQIRREMKRIRQEGIAYSNSERVPGASGIGAPIYSDGGEVIAALVVAGPADRFLKHVKEHEPHLRDAAAECSRLAGGLVKTR